MQRTEDQIISKAPIEVTFGSTKYSIPVLTIKAQREWRARVAEQIGELVSGMDADLSTATLPQLSRGFTATLVAFPDKLAELVFAYDPALPREVIETDATEEQVSAAFSKIMVVAYPFVAPLNLLKQAVRASR
jgi:hypothetical protein